jgi:23S rRNA pseudouridine1911/1915/1917 synthase
LVRSDLGTGRTRRRGRKFHIVYEDDVLVVVDKSPLVLTVPTAKGETNTLVQLLQRVVFPTRSHARLEIVHRLDRETSGLLVFAKDRASGDRLRAEFRRHAPEREYVAIVAGAIGGDEGTFDSHLVTGKSLTRRRARPGEGGERAVTHFRVIARRAGATTVRVRLETGRRNQIRVHFAEAGHPVLGDTRYRREIARHALWPYKRLALHAAVLGVRHPATGELMRWESDVPREFRPFLGRAGGRSALPRSPEVRRPSAATRESARARSRSNPRREA